MSLPETPEKVEDLDLLKRLARYGAGKATWEGTRKGKLVV